MGFQRQSDFFFFGLYYISVLSKFLLCVDLVF